MIGEPQKSIAEKLKLNPRNKTGKALKILTPRKFLTRVSVLLTKVKAWNH